MKNISGNHSILHILDDEELSREESPWNIITKHINRIKEREQITVILWANILSIGNVRDAANILGIADNPDCGRVRLHYIIKKHNLQDFLEQKSKEILYDCQRAADGDSEKGAELLSHKLSEIFPFLPEPEISVDKFERLLRKFKLSI